MSELIEEKKNVTKNNDWTQIQQIQDQILCFNSQNIRLWIDAIWLPMYFILFYFKLRYGFLLPTFFRANEIKNLKKVWGELFGFRAFFPWTKNIFWPDTTSMSWSMF